MRKLKQNKLITCECYPDDEFFKLIFSDGFIFKKGNGKSDVLNKIEKLSENYSFIIGVVDEDPYVTKPSKLLVNYDIIQHYEFFCIYKHKTYSALIIEQKVDLEYVLIKLAYKLGILLNKYGLKEDSRLLHNQIAHKKAKIPKSYFQFINELVNASDELRRLKSFTLGQFQI